MAEPITESTGRQDMLAQVREGMEVYDRNGKKVGKVKTLFMGAITDARDAGSEPTTTAGADIDDQGMISDFVAIFDPDGSLPDVVRNRMRHNGFIAIDGGMLHRESYALREHVAAVSGDRVELNIAGDGLIKR